MRKRHFTRGQSPTFTCITCERVTRDTGQGVDHLCHACFEIAGLDNQVNDSGEPAPASVIEECAIHLAYIAVRGGNVARVKAHNTFIWPKAEVTASALPTAAYLQHRNAWFWIELLGSRMTYFGPYKTEQDAREHKQGAGEKFS